jgi:hypothetical protein
MPPNSPRYLETNNSLITKVECFYTCQEAQLCENNSVYLDGIIKYCVKDLVLLFGEYNDIKSSLNPHAPLTAINKHIMALYYDRISDIIIDAFSRALIDIIPRYNYDNSIVSKINTLVENFKPMIVSRLHCFMFLTDLQANNNNVNTLMYSNMELWMSFINKVNELLNTTTKYPLIKLIYTENKSISHQVKESLCSCKLVRFGDNNVPTPEFDGMLMFLLFILIVSSLLYFLVIK